MNLMNVTTLAQEDEERIVMALFRGRAHCWLERRDSKSSGYLPACLPGANITSTIMSENDNTCAAAHRHDHDGRRRRRWDGRLLLPANNTEWRGWLSFGSSRPLRPRRFELRRCAVPTTIVLLSLLLLLSFARLHHLLALIYIRVVHTQHGLRAPRNK